MTASTAASPNGQPVKPRGIIIFDINSILRLEAAIDSGLKRHDRAAIPIGHGLDIFDFLGKYGFKIKYHEMVSMLAGGVLKDGPSLDSLLNEQREATHPHHTQTFCKGVARGEKPGIELVSTNLPDQASTYLRRLHEIIGRTDVGRISTLRHTLCESKHGFCKVATLSLLQRELQTGEDVPIFYLSDHNLGRKEAMQMAQQFGATGRVTVLNSNGLVAAMLSNRLHLQLGLNDKATAEDIMRSMDIHMITRGRDSTHLPTIIDSDHVGGDMQAGNHPFSKAIEQLAADLKQGTALPLVVPHAGAENGTVEHSVNGVVKEGTPLSEAQSRLLEKAEEQRRARLTSRFGTRQQPGGPSHAGRS